jgi:hypothetical protein
VLASIACLVALRSSATFFVSCFFASGGTACCATACTGIHQFIAQTPSDLGGRWVAQSTHKIPTGLLRHPFEGDCLEAIGNISECLTLGILIQPVLQVTQMSER